MIDRAGARRWLVAAGLVLAACGSGDDDSDGLDVRDAWARATPSGVTVGATYLTIRSPTDDVLEGITTPVAGRAEVHMTMAGANGTSMMHAVDGLELPAGEDVVLEPNGYHVMLIDLVQPLADGDSFELTLALAEAADVTVSVDVREGT